MLLKVSGFNFVIYIFTKFFSAGITWAVSGRSESRLLAGDERPLIKFSRLQVVLK
jgi:hypothetical protein